MVDRPTRDQKRARRLYDDARDNQDSEPVAYIDQDGNIQLWQGDEVAPWMRLLNSESDPLIIELLSGSSPLSHETVLAANSIVAKTSAGVVYQVYAYNPTASPVFLQLRDGVATGVPTHAPLPILANSWGSIDFGVWGKEHASGIVVQLSSTDVTFTGVNGSLTVLYR